MSENAEPSQTSKQQDAQSDAAGSDAPATASETVNASSTTADSSVAESSTAASSTAASSTAASEASTSNAPDGGGATSTAASSPANSGAEISALAAHSNRSAAAASSAPKSRTEAASTKSTGETSASAMAAAGPAGSSRTSRKSHVEAKAEGAEASPATKRGRSQKIGQLKLEEAKIGIIGAGKMADALVQGLIHYVKIQPARIHLAAPSAKNLEHFKNYGCRVTKRNYDIFGRYDCDIIFLCFHGYVIKHCYKLGGAKPHPLTTNYIPHQRHPIYILSMVSGVSLAQIKACLLNPESNNRYALEIHRVMMNTAVGHGLGICAIDCEPDSKKLSAPIRQLLSRVAQLEYVPASQMDAACALGGSGLAFSYYFISALADGAFKMGLSRKQAIRFASKTASCAAQTMLESGKHPAELRDTVSAPSGAAIYGIHVLERNDVASGVTAAVEAAHKRAIDLATQEMS